MKGQTRESWAGMAQRDLANSSIPEEDKARMVAEMVSMEVIYMAVRHQQNSWFVRLLLKIGL